MNKTELLASQSKDSAMNDELRKEIGERLGHYTDCRFDKAAYGRLPGETCTCGRDALLARLTTLEAARAADQARVEGLKGLLRRSGAYMQPPREAHHRFAEGWRDARTTYDRLLAETRAALASQPGDGS